MLLVSDALIHAPEWPGLGLHRDGESAVIRKTRIVSADLLQGKSGGLRYVFEEVDCADGRRYAIGLTVYLHQSSGNSEQEVRERVKDRQRAYTTDEIPDVLPVPHVETEA